MGVCASAPKAEAAIPPSAKDGSPRMAPGIESSDDLLSVGSNPDFSAIRAIDSLPNIAEVCVRGTCRRCVAASLPSACISSAPLRVSSRALTRAPLPTPRLPLRRTRRRATQTNPGIATVFDVLTPTKGSGGKAVGAGDAAAVGSLDNFALGGSASGSAAPSSRGKVRAAAKDGGGALSPVLEARTAPPATPGVFGADDADADMSPAQILERRRSSKGKSGAKPVLGGSEKAKRNPSLPPRLAVGPSTPSLPSRPGLKKSATAPTSAMGNALERLKRKAQVRSQKITVLTLRANPFLTRILT